MHKWFGRKRKEQPAPPWMKWLLIVFVLYAVVSNMGKDKPGDKPAPLKSAMNDIESSINLSEYKGKIFPDSDVPLRIKELAAGSGNPAICGQDVKIAYASFFPDGKLAEKSASKDTPLAFRIGDGEAMPALEQGVIGMREGGSRSVIASPSMATGMDTSKSDLVRLDIELLSLSPTLPNFESTPYRIAEVAAGARATVLCGQPVKAKVTVWSTEGKKLFAAKEPLEFTPGKSETFLGLEQGVIGMRVGGMRTLVVPPTFQKTMHGNKPVVDIPLPKTQTVLVDVEAF